MPIKDQVEVARALRDTISLVLALVCFRHPWADGLATSFLFLAWAVFASFKESLVEHSQIGKLTHPKILKRLRK